MHFVSLSNLVGSSNACEKMNQQRQTGAAGLLFTSFIPSHLFLPLCICISFRVFLANSGLPCLSSWRLSIPRPKTKVKYEPLLSTSSCLSSFPEY